MRSGWAAPADPVAGADRAAALALRDRSSQDAFEPGPVPRRPGGRAPFIDPPPGFGRGVLASFGEGEGEGQARDSPLAPARPGRCRSCRDERASKAAANEPDSDGDHRHFFLRSRGTIGCRSNVERPLGFGLGVRACGGVFFAAGFGVGLALPAAGFFLSAIGNDGRRRARVRSGSSGGRCAPCPLLGPGDSLGGLTSGCETRGGRFGAVRFE